jgi:hypothetical protein
MDTIQSFNVDDLPNSSFNVFLAKRRGGKSILCEHLIKQLIAIKKVDCCFLFSKTDAGFDVIKDKKCRFKEIDQLHTIIDNYKQMNEYNKIAKKKDKIGLKTIVVIDDFAVDLKSSKFNLLEDLSVLGRHHAYFPASLSFFILSQSLTKIPRVVRLNCDTIFINAVASEMERGMILNENMYLIDGSRTGKNEGRDLYQQIVTSEPFQFMVIENFKQNCICYSDYIKKYVAVL